MEKITQDIQLKRRGEDDFYFDECELEVYESSNDELVFKLAEYGNNFVFKIEKDKLLKICDFFKG